jgi:hypothetical protein
LLADDGEFVMMLSSWVIGTARPETLKVAALLLTLTPVMVPMAAVVAVTAELLAAVALTWIV